mmetsp:Transcript_11107/g.24459  ORF Transcript_11107/g.24459 Transcript_11107/m.24459 type:complete len:262 (+) Transcript_11107:1592-2377(+)
MGHTLREDLTGSHVLHAGSDLLSIGGSVICKLQVDGLDLISLGPDDLSALHGGNGLVTPELDDHRSLVEANASVVRSGLDGDGPASLQEIPEGGLKAVGVLVPHPQGSVLGAGHDNGQCRVEDSGGDVALVTNQGVHTAPRLVIPDPDGLVVGSGDQVRLLPTRAVLDTVHTFGVPVQAEMGGGGPASDSPHSDAAVKRTRRKDMVVLRVPLHHHHVVGVPLEGLRVLPILVPIPQTNRHIVGTRQEVGQGGMHGQVPNVI